LIKLKDIRNAYIEEGVSYLDASSRAVQDVILSLIASSSFAKNITIKGGVVIQHISNDTRRATQDLDFDFLRYSISDESIRGFIDKLARQSDEISLDIIDPVEEMKHQDYHGKRVRIRLIDKDGTAIETKLDIGVHKNLSVSQQEYYFDLSKLQDGVTLLGNTKEQIFTEKLKSLLRLGTLTTRYKDIFDMYYLAIHENMDLKALISDITTLIFSDRTMREKNIDDINIRLNNVLNDTRFLMKLVRSKRSNWLEISPELIVQALLEFVKTLSLLKRS
jgi:predicted nucleotidyltransferase component of viral defense system